jgi:GNAT superfamily N-acetyltransferase
MAADPTTNSARSDWIHPYAPADLPRLERLYAEAWPGDRERKATAFRWIEEQNPFRDSENGYLVLEREEEIVGYWGRMPTRLHFDGQAIPAAYSQETLVSPAVRRQGVARRLGEVVDGSAIPLLSLWHNEKMHAIMTRAAWQEVGRYRPLKKVYRLEALARREVERRPLVARGLRFAEPLVRLLARPAARQDEPIAIEEIERFDAEVDDLFARGAPDLGIIAERTTQTLNWKYVDIPHRTFRLLAARSRDGRLVGYLVLDIEDVPPFRRGTAVDILADPDVPDAALALAAEADRIFAAAGVDLAVALTTDPVWLRAFRKRRFFKARTTRTSSLLARNIPNEIGDAARDLNGWYLTFGDSDGHMW